MIEKEKLFNILILIVVAIPFIFNSSVSLNFFSFALLGIIMIVKILVIGALLKNNKLNRKDNPIIYYSTLTFFALFAIIMTILGIVGL
jgi:hypothetical protein